MNTHDLDSGFQMLLAVTAGDYGGEIATVHWVSKGSAVVIYKEAACARSRQCVRDAFVVTDPSKQPNIYIYIYI